MVAQHVAVRHPQRVASLLVACTGASVDPATMEQRAARVLADGMAGVLEETLARCSRRRRSRCVRTIRGRVRARTLLALEPATFADGWLAIAGHDIVARSARSRFDELPRRVGDTASPFSRRESSASACPAHACRARRPHMMHLERPVVFAAALSEHLRWAGSSECRCRCSGRACDEITAAVFETFRQEGRDPIALYRVLAHSPPMLRAYAGLARGLRYDAATPRALRELMILRTAQ